MARLRSKSLGPQQGWYFVNRATGHTIEARNGEQLLDQVIKHRSAFKLGETDRALVWREIEIQICAGQDSQTCIGEPGDGWEPIANKIPRLTLQHIMRATNALLRFIMGGAQWTDEKIADKRRDPCLDCRLNFPLAKCDCLPLRTLLEEQLPPERNDKRFGVCAACGCSINVKANLPESVLRKVIRSDEKFPVYCFQRDYRPEP